MRSRGAFLLCPSFANRRSPSLRGRLSGSCVTRDELSKFVTETVSEKVSLLVTDQWIGYHGLRQVYGDRHQIIRHSDHEYVVGAVHTNTIEGFWSIFKRGVVGTFHKVSAKYLPLYVAEFQFRYNNRSNPDMFGSAIAGC
jgi:ISXO2-like transposase domain